MSVSPWGEAAAGAGASPPQPKEFMSLNNLLEKQLISLDGVETHGLDALRALRKVGPCTFFFFFFRFIEPQGAAHGELNQPSPQFQADRTQSVKVHGRIEGHSNLMLILLIVYSCFLFAHVYFFFLFLTFIEPHGAHVYECNRTHSPHPLN
jgi:hypothetical protein